LDVLKFSRCCSSFVLFAISVQSWTNRKLLSSSDFSFVNSLYLVLYACIQTFVVIGAKAYLAGFLQRL
jgi:hypothetical protein